MTLYLFAVHKFILFEKFGLCLNPISKIAFKTNEKKQEKILSGWEGSKYFGFYFS